MVLIGLVLVGVAVTMVPIPGFNSPSPDAASDVAPQVGGTVEPGSALPIPPSTVATVTTVASTDLPPTPVDLDGIARIVAVLTPQQRDQVLNDPKAFERLVSEESARRAVLLAARANNLQSDERIAFLMRRGAEQALLESFIGLKANDTIAADFPTPEQVATFHADNVARFTVEERVEVWQIFLAVGTDDQLVEATNKANTIISQLKDGTLSFAAAAGKYSMHPQSRLQGGYLGQLKMSDLVVPVRERIGNLAPGEVSEPIRGERGLHIIRRGAILPATVVPLEDVTQTIRNDLRASAVRQVRQAIFTEASKRYGPDIAELDQEEWRVDLLKKLEAVSKKP